MPTRSAKPQLAKVAERQWGRVTRGQLTELGVDPHTVADWLKDGYLHRLLPRVYAVGHAGRSTEGDLAAALLYAGPGAMLSHATAAWWLDLLDRRPNTVEVSTPRRCRSRPGIRIHQRRACERVMHRGLPISSVPQTLLDYATAASWPSLRRVLANADYRRMLNLAALGPELRSGRPGGARLGTALECHRPELARVRSDPEVKFFELCQRAHIPLPKVNTRVHGWLVDFCWPERGLVVEVDGYGNHRSPAQIRRDRRMDLALRSQGLEVRRYSDEQVKDHGAAVRAELTEALRAIAPEPSAGSGIPDRS